VKDDCAIVRRQSLVELVTRALSTTGTSLVARPPPPPP